MYRSFDKKSSPSPFFLQINYYLWELIKSLLLLMLYAEIVLPLAQPAYSFSIPQGMELECGDAVAVQFGPRNFYTGIVWSISNQAPAYKHIKPIIRRLYSHPLLSAEQMRFWQWLADYYMCTLGEVMRMALPSLIKPRAQSEEAFSADIFSPPKEHCLRLMSAWSDVSAVESEIARIERRAPRRADVLRDMVVFLRRGEREVPRYALPYDSALLLTMRRSGYLESVYRPRQYSSFSDCPFTLPIPSPAQKDIIEQIRTSQQAATTVHLLRGITGSGKTEIYMQFIAEVVRRGGDVLFLVPEIALTAQLIERLERVFGERVTAYHSKLTAQRRTETFLRLSQSAGGEIVIGARSALFLPLKHLQLIVVDEEHDQSYKQSDSAPRYNGRDAAVVLASLCGGRVILGSATPSLESYANALSGKYGYSELLERYGEAVPPQIVISDTRRALKRGERRGHFNLDLKQAISARLARGEQVMLFQNRRGYSPALQCGDCGWSMRCPNCNVALTLHRNKQRMECHYCGHSEAVPSHCPNCRTTELTMIGFGTEKAEDAVRELFPGKSVLRLDSDTSTSERAYNTIIREFEQGRADILVGTQMITKGFDFGNVSLVGIMNADNLMLSPDFRASERAFQLLTQVAGRAGRRERAGEVIIQTSEADNPVLKWVERGDYQAMVRRELSEREMFGYPPYSRLVALTLRYSDAPLLREAASTLAKRLRERFGGRVFGPVEPYVNRVRGEWIVQILLKVEHRSSIAKAKDILRGMLSDFGQIKEWKKINIVIDVDPQ